MFFDLLTSGTNTNTVSGILQETGNVVTNILTWVGNVAETIVETPLLFIGVGLFVMGAAVSFVHRLLKR